MTPAPHLSPPATSVDAGRRLADAVTRHYALDVRSITRIAKGMGTTNWRVRTSAGDCFLKQYPPAADVDAEATALEKGLAFVEAYCRTNPDVGRADVQLAPQVWAIQLARSEYGLRQHYFGPLERQADLDRFWLQRCEAAELILARLDELSERFGSAWTRRGG